MSQISAPAIAPLIEYPTRTHSWTLVVQRVGARQAEIWLGTLDPNLKMPEQIRLVLWRKGVDAPGKPWRIVNADRSAWQRPFQKLKQRFYMVLTLQDLDVDQVYSVRFDRKLDPLAGFGDDAWQDVCSGEFRTLPQALPSASGSERFTVAFGSCFYPHRDQGCAAAAFRALHEAGPSALRPDLSFWLGDQVYLDIGIDSISFRPQEITERIAEDYRKNWELQGDLLRRGANWMLPDDHEFWNDYPFYDSAIPTLWPLRLGPVRRAWAAAAMDGVQRVQRPRPIEVIEIGRDLSFCLLDTRTYRSSKEFVSAETMSGLLAWIQSLKSSGVLVISQNLIQDPDKSERSLASYPKQYGALLAALRDAPHDVLCLTGDVHYGRVGQVNWGNGRRLVEAVASPLSNLTGLSGIATAVAVGGPTPLKTPIGVFKPEFKPEHWVVAAPSDLVSGYPCRRTREHFMTASFCRHAEGVQVEIDAWLVRQMDASGLPQRGMREGFRVVLR
jgi:hypothetical protein